MSAPGRKPPEKDDEGGLDRLAAVAAQPTVARAVESARELLDMDVAYATEFTETDQVFRTLRGDGESFSIQQGTVMRLEDTYCQKILAGELPTLIPDVRADSVAAAMPVSAAANVGSFASVPVRFSDGTLYGTLCVASHRPRNDLGKRDAQFLEVFARMIADQVEREILTASARRLELQEATVGALTAALAARDDYTAAHSLAVVGHAAAVARRLGLSAERVHEAELVAVLHDIGKIATPDALLKKRGPLDAEEWETMRLHPVHGEALVAAIDGIRHLAPAVRAEHERWDGSGYPDGLAGEGIPLVSRIVLACDAYNAMCSDRPYRAAMATEEAREEIRHGLGSQFCPTAGAALLAIVEGEGVPASEPEGS